MTDNEKSCGKCVHFSGGQVSECKLPLPWWAEPYDRPRIYSVEGNDCPAFKNAFE